jgi:hypothetical protein
MTSDMRGRSERWDAPGGIMRAGEQREVVPAAVAALVARWSDARRLVQPGAPRRRRAKWIAA